MNAPEIQTDFCEKQMSHSPSNALHVGIVCDFVEERWHSMDLVAEMLLKNLESTYQGEIHASLLRAPFRRHFMGWPFVGKTKTAYNIDRLTNRFYRYPSWLRARRGAFQLFHVVDHSYAHLVHELPPESAVVTCHDADSLRDLFLDGYSLRSHVLRRMSRRILTGMQRAARVTCDSVATREELLAHDWVPAEKLTVVPLGVDPMFRLDPDQNTDAVLTNLLGSAAGKLKVLHVGSTISRKRIDVLLRTFARVKQAFPDAVLLRAGGAFNEQQSVLLKELHLEQSIFVLPFLESRLLPALYRSSAVLLLPSEREGFGLPVIESMACGTPVVASDIGVLREAGGDAALYCHVGDAEAFSVTVCQLLSQMQTRPEDYRLQQRACILQATKYSWSKYTEKSVELYRETFAQSKPSGSVV